MKHPKIPAEIVEAPTQENGYFWVIDTEGGPGRLFLRGIGAPKGKPGDKGYVRYSSNGSFGSYYWIPKE